MVLPFPSLPNDPLNYDFEDFFSGFFQLFGHYIETNLINQSKDTILELDIIASKYSSESELQIHLIEVKSGCFGYDDIFKVRGWIDYLKDYNGIMIGKDKSEHSDLDQLNSIANRLDIKLFIIPNIEDLSQLSQFGNISETNRIELDIWRYVAKFERIFEKYLNDGSKVGGIMRFRAIKKYYRSINNKIFFIDIILIKVLMLYQLYLENINISAKCGNEMLGSDFNQDCSSMHKRNYYSTFVFNQLNEIQISAYIEYRAKLSILKCAVDYLVYSNIGQTTKTIDLKGTDFDLWESTPTSFKSGLDTLKSHPYFYKYPYFWQLFMWYFGGFLLRNNYEVEYEYLAEKTGIPVEEIPNALKAFDILFPTTNSWFREIDSDLLILKLFPAPFAGLGVFSRLNLFNKEDFNDLSRSYKTRLFLKEKYDCARKMFSSYSN